jgi:hypothetical protein
MTGGAFGSIFAQMFHLSSAERKTLLVAGAAEMIRSCHPAKTNSCSANEPFVWVYLLSKNRQLSTPTIATRCNNLILQPGFRAERLTYKTYVAQCAAVLQYISECLKENAMPSQSRATRENQKNLYDQRIQERRADLEKKGIAAKDFSKDPVYEHLKAKRRSIIKAIAAIDDINARNERHKEAPAEKAAPAPAVAEEKKPKKEKPKKSAPPKAGQ